MGTHYGVGGQISLTGPHNITTRLPYPGISNSLWTQPNPQPQTSQAIFFQPPPNPQSQVGDYPPPPYTEPFMGGSCQLAQPQQFVGGPFPTAHGPTSVMTMPHHYYLNSQVNLQLPFLATLYLLDLLRLTNDPIWNQPSSHLYLTNFLMIFLNSVNV
jgi:hypothetical protein